MPHIYISQRYILNSALEIHKMHDAKILISNCRNFYHKASTMSSCFKRTILQSDIIFLSIYASYLLSPLDMKV